jgi:hypothetical protein
MPKENFLVPFISVVILRGNMVTKASVAKKR